MTRVPDSELVLVPGGSLITAGATLPRSAGPVGGACCWTAPLAFTVMVAVSIATRRRTPAGVGATMLRLHASETLRAVNGPAMGARAVTCCVPGTSADSWRSGW